MGCDEIDQLFWIISASVTGAIFVFVIWAAIEIICKCHCCPMWQCRKYVAPPPPPPQKRKVNAPIIKQIVYATSSEEEIVTESRSHLESRELQLDEEVVIRKKATGETVRKQALGASLQSKLHDSVKEHYERGADHVASYQDSVHGTKIVKKSTSPKP